MEITFCILKTMVTNRNLAPKIVLCQYQNYLTVNEIGKYFTHISIARFARNQEVNVMLMINIIIGYLMTVEQITMKISRKENSW